MKQFKDWGLGWKILLIQICCISLSVAVLASAAGWVFNNNTYKAMHQQLLLENARVVSLLQMVVAAEPAVTPARAGALLDELQQRFPPIAGVAKSMTHRVVAGDKWQGAADASTAAIDWSTVFTNASGAKIYAVYSPVPGASGVLGVITEIDQDVADEPLRVFNFWIIFSSVAPGLLLYLVTYLLSRKVLVRPINELVSAVQALHQGDGDFTRRLVKKSEDELGQLAEAFNNFIAKQQAVLIGVVNTIDHLSTSSALISSSAASVSDSSSEQASSVEETSAALEQMSVTIAQNTENARSTEQIAAQSADIARAGSEVVGQAVSEMQKIAEKVLLIDEIAHTTNLLALNAEIEAARAGDHGRGFAVVATEVRKLAERSKQTASEITALAANVASVAKNAGTILEQIVPRVVQTSELVREIYNASEEQQSGVEQINVAVGQIESSTRRSAETSESLSHAVDDINSNIQKLRDQALFFKLK